MTQKYEEAVAHLREEQLLPLYTATDLSVLPVVEDIMLENGISLLEVAYRSELAGQAIKKLSDSRKVIAGAGTVRDLDTARDAVVNGAKFIVTPGLNAEVLEYCRDNDIPCFPGIATPTEALMAMRYGYKVVKFFPAAAYGGLKTIKALQGPLYDFQFVPTGGINEDNYLEYLANDAIIAVGGSFILSEKAVKQDGGKRANARLKELVARLV